MNRKMLVVAIVIVLATGVGYTGGRAGVTAGSGLSDLSALTASPDTKAGVQPQTRSQTQNQNETKPQTDMSLVQVAPENPLAPVGTGFTYQGRLSQAGVPSSGQFDFVFTLYDAAAGGNQAGDPSAITLTNQTVTGGLFTVELGFGISAFYGDARWLELAVRQTGAGAYSTLSPRQPLTPAPYAQSSTWFGASGKPAPYNPVRATNAATTIDSADNVGFYTSITIGVDGLPIISNWDNSNADLKVVHCSNPACTSATTTRIDNVGTGIVGEYTSITIGVDGLPIISYHDRTNADLKVAHCSNIACTSAITTTLDSTGVVGQYTSITIGVDELPIISYFDDTNDDLKVAHCATTACTSATTAIIDSGSGVGFDTSITIGVDGLPIISYRDSANNVLKVAHCSNTACTSATIATLDSPGSDGFDTSITIGVDGLPIISYYKGSTRDLKVAHCSNTACTSATSTTIDSTGDVGTYTSITIGVDGLPIISYRDFTNLDLKVAHCTNTACTSATSTTIDSTGSIGQYTSITIGVDGLPIISYHHDTNFDLKVMHCGSPFCASNVHRR